VDRPAHFIRPFVWNNLFVRSGDVVDGLSDAPQFDFFNFHEAPGIQTRDGLLSNVVARGTSVTQVGFRLAHDGIDGLGR